MFRPLQRFVALCLALIWVPATLCCAIEAAGLEVLCSDCNCHSPDDGQAPLDGCSVVETGHYQSVAPTTKAVPPVASVSAFLLPLSEAAIAAPMSDAAPRERWERPPDWVVRWQFERRAAAPAHAPDSLIG